MLRHILIRSSSVSSSFSCWSWGSVPSSPCSRGEHHPSRRGIAVGRNPTGHTSRVERIDETWTMRDGVKLPVRYSTPAARPLKFRGAGLYPRSSSSTPGLRKDLFEGAASEYAARGYVCVTSRCRMFGAEGQIGCMDPANEVRDISDIHHPGQRGRAFPVLWTTRAGSRRHGYSMGACLSYLISPRKDPRRETRATQVTRRRPHARRDRSRLLHPANGGAKALWECSCSRSYIGNIAGFFLSTMNLLIRQDLNAWQKLTEPLRSAGKLTSPFSNVIHARVDRRGGPGTQGRRRREGRQYLRDAHSLLCDAEYDGVIEHPVTVPTLMVAGWNDDSSMHTRPLSTSPPAWMPPARVIVTTTAHGGIGQLLHPFPGQRRIRLVNARIEMCSTTISKARIAGGSSAAPLFLSRPGTYGSRLLPPARTQPSPCISMRQLRGEALHAAPSAAVSNGRHC